MKLQKRNRFRLLVFLAVVPLAIFYAGTGEAIFGDGEQWICTPAALAKEQAGYCSAGKTCRELCYLNEPQNYFQCFNN